jgi:hypothetical protein
VVSSAFTNGNQYGGSIRPPFNTLKEAIGYYITSESPSFEVFEFDTAAEMFTWIGKELSASGK